MKENFDLERFIKAQEHSYEDALLELKNGKKRSHWMWYIFPQVVGLGHSSMAQKYGIKNLKEAKAYLAQPTLGQRLKSCCHALLDIHDRSAHDIFGSPDDIKLKSSMTLFYIAEEGNSIFMKVLEKYYGGKCDTKTLDILKNTP
ncbi:DUF1810 domain-containing protein [Microbulbifer sp. MLAF003]|uniref:DUF1810 domain-containing protein n=1 Tax=unclassified Microbulbifer TaxID=2619833 RepID=UPI0024AD6F7D|nr:DUF1810 domain-containing protein [Microbulbifer sp. MLAF003]WHI51408.1 DUF1810 domain-containing protein [Microbulbifer sp. MLAF003]